MPEQPKPQRLARDSGTIAPLVAGYLALLVMVFTMATNVVAGMAFANRVQGVADLGLLYAHERSLRVGIPQLADLETNFAHYFRYSKAAQGMTWEGARFEIQGPRSILELCVRFRFPISFDQRVVCRKSSAQSFLVL